jgi:hypothetical protein
MYSTCLFCHSSLGANEVVEAFPIGRRLAFDAARGRLWVVCRRCERWNLTPLEERWEAIETCERLFRGARLRASTGQIGLARLTEGLELVRVGEPLRPEMAAWRYGDQFGRRRRKALLRTGAGLVFVGGLAVGGVTLGAPAAALWALTMAGTRRAIVGREGDLVALIPQADGPALVVRRGALHSARLAWELGSRDWVLELGDGEGMIVVRGADRVRVAGLLLPAVNRNGANGRVTRDALALLERHGSPDALFTAEAREWEGTTRMGYRDAPGGRVEFIAEGPRGFLARLEPAHRLALEMAAHEESERHALAGELALLVEAWRAAEEIAAIADSLLISDTVRDAEVRLRKRVPPIDA